MAPEAARQDTAAIQSAEPRERAMSDKTSDFVSFAGLWITLIASILLLVQQLASNGIIG
jgi:hypothetical protein